jgi:hypothetical protein
MMEPNAIRSLLAVGCLALASGCGQDLNVGSDVLWSSRFEVGENSFPEWTSVPFGFGGAGPVPDPNTPNQPNTIEVSGEHFHPGQGKLAAKLTISDTADNTTGIGASLVQSGSLPNQAYYSAWYYLPQSVFVGYYWVIMKFRFRTVPDDLNTAQELFDVNLTSPSAGVMSLRLYDHLTGMDQPLKVSNPPVAVNAWFQLEAFYRAAADNTGQLTLWLDGKLILDLAGATGPAGWVAWDVVSVGKSLNPEPAVLYVDDCAISKTRIGLTGLISE